MARKNKLATKVECLDMEEEVDDGFIDGDIVPGKDAE
jgi:hypothetical protein